MNKVFVDVGISLDGFLGGPNRGPHNPIGDGGLEIHKWMFAQKAFLQHLHLDASHGESNNKDNDIIEEIFQRIGANIMGRRMFDEGEANWPEEAPFGTPVFVLTHHLREPWERKGGTTFYFVNEDIHGVLEKAKQAAGNKDVRISGGASTIQQYVNAGLVDELQIHFAPILLGNGIRLFDNFEKGRFYIEPERVINSSRVTHIQYRVVKP